MTTTQRYTSANTSINAKRLPYVYSKADFKPMSKVLDYGCGKYTSHIQRALERKLCVYTPYDKYNQPYTQCNLIPNTYDYVVCSNVLNVIAESDIRLSIINDLYNVLKSNGMAYITVYDGDKSCNGKVSKNDCWQENKPLKEYLGIISSVFGESNVIIKNSIIYAHKI